MIVSYKDSKLQLEVEIEMEIADNQQVFLRRCTTERDPYSNMTTRLSLNRNKLLLPHGSICN